VGQDVLDENADQDEKEDKRQQAAPHPPVGRSAEPHPDREIRHAREDEQRPGPGGVKDGHSGDTPGIAGKKPRAENGGKLRFSGDEV
jgi:hypothetical protein